MATGQLIGRIGEPSEREGTISGGHEDQSDSPGGFGVLQANGGVTYEYVGKFGGGQSQYPVEINFPGWDVPITLPDGHWCLVLKLTGITQTSTFRVVYVNGVPSAQVYGQRIAHAAGRHLSGTATVSVSNTSLFPTVGWIAAFPDSPPA